MSSLMTEDFVRNLDKLDMESKQAILEQLLAEYDRSPHGTFPFPRSVISEFILRETTINIQTHQEPMQAVY